MVNAWMSWEGGFDLVAATMPGLDQPNVIVHVARVVHTPVGSAPSGMVLYAPQGMPPVVMGFVSTDRKVADYFGPNVFAGMPFEQAPSLVAGIDVTQDGDACSARVTIDGMVFEARVEGLGALEVFHREPAALPFTQDVLERAGSSASLKVNGEDVGLHLPPQGLSGGSPTLWSPTGLYSR